MQDKESSESVTQKWQGEDQESYKEAVKNERGGQWSGMQQSSAQVSDSWIYKQVLMPKENAGERSAKSDQKQTVSKGSGDNMRQLQPCESKTDHVQISEGQPCDGSERDQSSKAACPSQTSTDLGRYSKKQLDNSTGEKLSSQELQKMLFTDTFARGQNSQVLSAYYSEQTLDKIQKFLTNFLDDERCRTQQEFQEDLEHFYKLARIRYTKGGHKTNQDKKVRKSFICQCHGRGSSYERSDKYRKRDHFFSQSQCKSRVSIRQLEAGIDNWVIDRAELQHNHPPQSLEFFESQESKTIALEQKIFITACFKRNPKINGAEIRRKYKEAHPYATDMFGKKVQNMLQILRQGKDIIKEPEDWEKLRNVESGKEGLFDQKVKSESPESSSASKISEQPSDQKQSISPVSTFKTTPGSKGMAGTDFDKIPSNLPFCQFKKNSTPQVSPSLLRPRLTTSGSDVKLTPALSPDGLTGQAQNLYSLISTLLLKKRDLKSLSKQGQYQMIRNNSQQFQQPPILIQQASINSCKAAQVKQQQFSPLVLQRGEAEPRLAASNKYSSLIGKMMLPQSKVNLDSDEKLEERHTGSDEDVGQTIGHLPIKRQRTEGLSAPSTPILDMVDQKVSILLSNQAINQILQTAKTNSRPMSMSTNDSSQVSPAQLHQLQHGQNQLYNIIELQQKQIMALLNMNRAK